MMPKPSHKLMYTQAMCVCFFSHDTLGHEKNVIENTAMQALSTGENNYLRPEIDCGPILLLASYM